MFEVVEAPKSSSSHGSRCPWPCESPHLDDVIHEGPRPWAVRAASCQGSRAAGPSTSLISPASAVRPGWWIKRRWRCVDADCDVKTWTAHSHQAGLKRCSPAGPLPRRAPGGREDDRPVSRVVSDLGVCWWTVMNAVIERGAPLVDDPKRSFFSALQRGWSTSVDGRPWLKHQGRWDLDRLARSGPHSDLTAGSVMISVRRSCIALRSVLTFRTGRRNH